MRIVQGILLVLIGALGATFYVKIRGGLEPTVVQTASLPAPPAQLPEASPPAAPHAVEEPAAEEPAAVREPQLPPVRLAKKHPTRMVASLPPAPEPVSNPPTATQADVQPVQEPASVPVEPPPPPPVAVEPAPEAAPPPPEPEPTPAPRQATLTAGTLVSVRLRDSISSDRYHAGDLFTATLDQPLVVDGMVIAEKGARAEGKIVESQQAGRVKGLASIALELTSVKLSDGQHVEISTDSFTKRAPETHGADAEKIGGGAALGAIIGAIAGGGKGAAIGAGVGGAAGTGAVVGTRGKPAVLPSETRISFRINNTVTITERRGRS
jgi:hypothetical protein